MNVNREERVDKPKAYLAGAINGKSDSECLDWRREATDRLSGHYDVLDPMARDYRGSEAQNVDAIVSGDLADIASCQVVLVRAETPSWGTAMELVYAYKANKHIVAFGAGERPSPWLAFHATSLQPDLEQAVRHCIWETK